MSRKRQERDWATESDDEDGEVSVESGEQWRKGRVNDVAYLFDDEAVEAGGDDSDLDDGSEEEVDEENGTIHVFDSLEPARPPTPVPRDLPWTKKSKAEQRVCRHFAYTLIDRMLELEQDWEPEQVAEFISLVVEQLDLKPEQVVHLLVKTKSGTSITMCKMAAKGVTLTVDEILQVFLECSKTMWEFIANVNDALEVGVLTLHDPVMLDTLCGVAAGKNMDTAALTRYAKNLCEHCTAKQLCGEMLDRVTEHLTPQQSAQIAYSVVKMMAFKDLKGTFPSFLQAVSRFRSELMPLVEATHHFSKRGELVESDEDSEGNLKDFVVDDDEVILNTSAEEENSSDDDDDDDQSHLEDHTMGFYRRVDAVDDSDAVWTSPDVKTKKNNRKVKKSNKEVSSKTSNKSSSPKKTKRRKVEVDVEDSEGLVNTQETPAKKKHKKSSKSPNNGKRKVIHLNEDEEAKEDAARRRTSSSDSEDEEKAPVIKRSSTSQSNGNNVSRSAASSTSASAATAPTKGPVNGKKSKSPAKKKGYNPKDVICLSPDGDEDEAWESNKGWLAKMVEEREDEIQDEEGYDADW